MEGGVEPNVEAGALGKAGPVELSDLVHVVDEDPLAFGLREPVAVGWHLVRLLPLLLLVTFEEHLQLVRQVVEVPVLHNVDATFGRDLVGLGLQLVDQLAPLAVEVGPDAETCQQLLVAGHDHTRFLGLAQVR